MDLKGKAALVTAASRSRAPSGGRTRWARHEPRAHGPVRPRDDAIGFIRVLRSDYRDRGVTASVLLLGAIRGAGQGQRSLDDMKRPSSSFMAPVETVTKALLRALDRDKAEIVVMPGPGRLMRALMDFYPSMGPWMNRQMRINRTLREVQDFRRSAKHSA